MASGAPADALTPAWRAWDSGTNSTHRTKLRALACWWGTCLRALGDEESATAALLAAKQTFQELGAQPQMIEADKLLRHTVGGLTGREVDVLRLVAAGRQS